MSTLAYRLLGCFLSSTRMEHVKPLSACVTICDRCRVRFVLPIQRLIYLVGRLITVAALQPVFHVYATDRQTDRQVGRQIGRRDCTAPHERCGVICGGMIHFTCMVGSCHGVGIVCDIVRRRQGIPCTLLCAASWRII